MSSSNWRGEFSALNYSLIQPPCLFGCFQQIFVQTPNLMSTWRMQVIINLIYSTNVSCLWSVLNVIQKVFIKSLVKQNIFTDGHFNSSQSSTYKSTDEPFEVTYLHDQKYRGETKLQQQDTHQLNLMKRSNSVLRA